MSRRNDWTREQHIIAFNVYSQIPFGQIDESNPKVQELAKLVGRTVGAASLKLANFARLDPALQKRGIKGMPHGSKGEAEVWREFAGDPERLALESEKLVAERMGRPIEETSGIETEDLPEPGEEREALVRLRVKQSFFRKRVLSAYNFRCCVSGLTVRPLLVASHIVPWAIDAKNRLNPRNGLCLNALHDRAFDRHLMWVEGDLTVRFSPRLRQKSQVAAQAVEWLLSFEGKPLVLPSKFRPDQGFLSAHADRAKGIVGAA